MRLPSQAGTLKAKRTRLERRGPGCSENMLQVSHSASRCSSNLRISSSVSASCGSSKSVGKEICSRAMTPPPENLSSPSEGGSSFQLTRSRPNKPLPPTMVELDCIDFKEAKEHGCFSSCVSSCSEHSPPETKTRSHDACQSSELALNQAPQKLSAFALAPLSYYSPMLERLESQRGNSSNLSFLLSMLHPSDCPLAQANSDLLFPYSRKSSICRYQNSAGFVRFGISAIAGPVTKVDDA